MRYIVQALVYSFYDYCFSSLALLVALQIAKKNDYVASRWKINRKKGKGKSVIQVELLTVHLTNLTHIPFAQLLFVFCIILVF